MIADSFEVHVPVLELVLRGTLDKIACLEGDGLISVIRKSGSPEPNGPSRSLPGLERQHFEVQFRIP